VVLVALLRDINTDEPRLSDTRRDNGLKGRMTLFGRRCPSHSGFTGPAGRFAWASQHSVRLSLLRLRKRPSFSSFGSVSGCHEFSQPSRCAAGAAGDNARASG